MLWPHHGIDAAKGTWKLTGKLLPQTIERLTHSVIVTSTGSSNRIEGNRLSDQQVEALYRNLRIKKFISRDEQEVAGYLEMLERIFVHYQDIPVKEPAILQLHRDMLRHSEKGCHEQTRTYRRRARNALKSPPGINLTGTNARLAVDSAPDAVFACQSQN